MLTYPSIEKAIIRGFFTNEVFVGKVIPYIKPEYFKLLPERELISEAIKFYTDYKKLPSVAALEIAVSANLAAQENIDDLHTYLDAIKSIDVETDWLIKHTEEFCRNAAYELSIGKAIETLHDDSKLSKSEIPKLIQDSLSITFEQTQSHDFFRDYQKQFEWYKEKTDKIAFDIQMLNKITSGGVERKTLNVLLAGTNGGKSLAMCHFACSYLMQGYNVLYITLELSENKVRQRIDANLLDIALDRFGDIDSDYYFSKVRRLQEKVKGVFKIQEYPPASVNTNHFRKLLQELALKDNFRPDIIFIDYLNLMNSARVKSGNPYEVVKAISEECRGLGVEHNAAIWSATQVNRSGYGNTDLSLENTSESMGLPFTSDLFLAISADDNMKTAGHALIKQLKSRYGDTSFHNKFIVGIDKMKMRIVDVAQENDESTHGSTFKGTKASSKGTKEDASDQPLGKSLRGEKNKMFDDFAF